MQPSLLAARRSDHRREAAQGLQVGPVQKRRPLAHTLIHLAVPLAVEVQPIGAEPLGPGRIAQQALQQWQERHIGLQAGLLQQPLVAAHLIQSVPEHLGVGHRRFIHRGQPQHQHRRAAAGLMQQLLQTEQEALRIQLVATIGPADAGGVVQADGQEDAVRQLAPQLTAAVHLLLQARGHPLQAIAAHTEGVEHGAAHRAHLAVNNATAN